MITISGYHEPLRRDRPINGRHGGGVLMYIAEHLVFTHKEDLQSEFYQHIWADVKLSNTTYSVNAFYRPPNESHEDHQHFLQTAETAFLGQNG